MLSVNIALAAFLSSLPQAFAAPTSDPGLIAPAQLVADSLEACSAQCDQAAGCATVSYIALSKACVLRSTTVDLMDEHNLLRARRISEDSAVSQRRRRNLLPLNLGSLGNVIEGVLPEQFSRPFDRPTGARTFGISTMFPSFGRPDGENRPTQVPTAVAAPIAAQPTIAIPTPSPAVAAAPIGDDSDTDADSTTFTTRTTTLTITSDIPTAAASVQVVAGPVTDANTVSTSTSAVVVASPAPASAVSNSGKRGLSYNNPASTKLFTSGKVSWIYNWAQTSGSGTNPGMMFIPMLWSDASNLEATWNSNAAAAIASGANALLAFNEPDLKTQSNMPVANAVTGYLRYMQPFAGKARLVSPAVTNSVAPGGLTYLQSFLAACTGCTIDAVAIHYYAGPDPEAFKTYVQQAYTAGGNRPLWITEIGVSGTAAQVKTFLTAVLPWLDSLSYVERYAYFMAGPSSDGTLLLNAAGTGLDDIGMLYNTL